MSAFAPDVVVICSPRPGGQHLPTARAIQADCGHGAWIDPANVAGLQARGETFRTICQPCVSAGHLPPGPATVTPEVRAQMHAQGWTDLQIDLVVRAMEREAEQGRLQRVCRTVLPEPFQ